MQTQRIEEHLKALDVPSFSVVGVITELGQQDLSLNQALEQIETLTGTRPNVTDMHEARLMYQYLIQDGLRLRKQGVENVETEWILDAALRKAVAFKTKHPYVFATEEEVVKVNVNGDVKHKKGWKQARAMELLKANPNIDRKDLIQLFMKELDMTLAGATTYFYIATRTLK